MTQMIINRKMFKITLWTQTTMKMSFKQRLHVHGHKVKLFKGVQCFDLRVRSFVSTDARQMFFSLQETNLMSHRLIRFESNRRAQLMGSTGSGNGVTWWHFCSISAGFIWVKFLIKTINIFKNCIKLLHVSLWKCWKSNYIHLIE